MKPKTIKRGVTVPLFKANVHLVVSDDPMQSAKDLFGDRISHRPILAKTVWDSSEPAAWLFFKRRRFTIPTIAHEVFHAAHYIVDHLGEEFSMNHSEPTAYLAEWITEWICREAKKAGVRVYV